MMRDGFGRVINYARISATDLCDLRCLYCMPEGCVKKSRREILSLEELGEISEVLAELGVSKQRVTGGEPLVRRGILNLLETMGADKKIDVLSLTTNGQRLPETAEDLKKAGVKNINVSLDSLDDGKYKLLTGGGKAEKVLEGIEKITALGFKVKLNSVLVKGVNDSEVYDLAVFARKRDIPVRFIELMPFSNQKNYAEEHFISVDEIVSKYGLTEAGRRGKAVRYLFPDGTPAEFIGAVSRKFCDGCDRIRITADGKLINCLHEAKEYDLKPYLGDKENMKDFITKCVLKKPAGHNLEKGVLQKRGMEDIGG